MRAKCVLTCDLTPNFYHYKRCRLGLGAAPNRLIDWPVFETDLALRGSARAGRADPYKEAAYSFRTRQMIKATRPPRHPNPTAAYLMRKAKNVPGLPVGSNVARNPTRQKAAVNTSIRLLAMAMITRMDVPTCQTRDRFKAGSWHTVHDRPRPTIPAASRQSSDVSAGYSVVNDPVHLSQLVSFWSSGTFAVLWKRQR